MRILVATSVLANGDPAGEKNIGNGAGKQFITGGCLSNADCASTCCAQQNGAGGVCSGIGAQFQAGKTGCGFNDPNAKKPSQPQATTAPPPPAQQQPPKKQGGSNKAGVVGGDPAGFKNVGNGAGTQFITGACVSNADCGSQCCAQQNGAGGVCSGVGAQFQAGKTGCGFNDPNAQQTIETAKKQAGGSQPQQQQQQQQQPQEQQQQKQPQQQGSNKVGGDPAGFANVGNGAGTQFITGACVSNADCASKCCAQQNGAGGFCSGIGAQFQAGKTGCGFSDPNAQQTIATAKQQAQSQGFKTLKGRVARALRV